MGPPTDEELMDRFCSGDGAAFDALFTRHAPGVQAFLHRMVRDRALAEDLLQMTFLSVVRSQDRFQPGAKVAPWLFSIAANTARDALRRRGRQAEDAMDEAAHQADTAVPSDPALARRIQEALDALPEQQREAVVLLRLHGWSFEDMAEALGCTSVAVRIRAHRGYERLRDVLGPLLEDA
jgi:RNA polymerase sigma-70 factor (ECF subfamily)